jgi:hypothetical protein
MKLIRLEVGYVSSCNVGLGKLRDSIEMLERGIKYLKGELNE